jgi:hypothetical protein
MTSFPPDEIAIDPGACAKDLAVLFCQTQKCIESLATKNEVEWDKYKNL